MWGNIWRMVRKGARRRVREIEPDEIFLDSSNLPSFDRSRLEGQIEYPIAKRALIVLGLAVVLVTALYLYKIADLQIDKGAEYALASENNRFEHSIVFADRGVIYDRLNTELAWNVRTEEEAFAERFYTGEGGFSHVLGHLTYPQKDTSGFYYQEQYVGQDGIERVFDELLNGENGLRITEMDARNERASESILERPERGESVALTLDAGVQAELYRLIEERAQESGFVGGAGIIMDVTNGDILALTSYPEYRPEVFATTTGSTSIASYINDERKPFLNRAVQGLYAPGSIIKPFMAVAALEERIVDPSKEILSTGALTLANPYNPSQPTIFRDWKAHGYVDLRRALAVSSDVYFYEIGGGFGDQPGLGIARIESYARKFGFGSTTDFTLGPEPEGTIPNPDWKQEQFGEEWRLGNTYHTVIGQYGFQVTPLQAVRAIAAIANGGKLLTPSLSTTDVMAAKPLGFSSANLAIVREGMRMAVTEGTAGGLNMREVAIAAKTGTAEIGAEKQYVNSWVLGFFPYERPKYAFVVVMERGPVKNLIGGVYIMRRLSEWMNVNRPHYLRGEEAPALTLE